MICVLFKIKFDDKIIIPSKNSRVKQPYERNWTMTIFETERLNIDEVVFPEEFVGESTAENILGLELE